MAYFLVQVRKKMVDINCYQIALRTAEWVLEQAVRKTGFFKEFCTESGRQVTDFRLKKCSLVCKWTFLRFLAVNSNLL